MRLDTTFRTDELPEGRGDFQPLPAGWYTANITEADVKTTKAGDGQYIKVRYDITGPSHEGRVVFGNFNIRNPNPKAEEIGRQQLGDVMRAIGLAELSDTDQLIGGRCQIKLKIRRSEEYGDSNDVAAFKPAEGGAKMPTQAQAPAPAPAPAAQASGKPPWAK